MFIDIAFIIVMILAIFRGINKGLLAGVFSLLAFIIGLAAALKLSVIVSAYLQARAGDSGKWLPFLSFTIVFIAVVILVGLLGKLIKKTMQVAMLGWLDKLGGIILFIVINTIIFSIFLFFAAKLLLIQPQTMEDSKVYPYVSQWGPKVIDNLGNIIPVFKDMFTQLQDFFGSLSEKTN